MNQCSRAKKKSKRVRQRRTQKTWRKKRRRNCTIVRKKVDGLGIFGIGGVSGGSSNPQTYICRHYAGIVFVLISGDGKAWSQGQMFAAPPMEHGKEKTGWRRKKEPTKQIKSKARPRRKPCVSRVFLSTLWGEWGIRGYPFDLFCPKNY